MFVYKEIPQSPYRLAPDDIRGYVRRKPKSRATDLTGSCGVCERRVKMTRDGYVCGSCGLIAHISCSNDLAPDHYVGNPIWTSKAEYVLCRACRSYD